MKHFLCLFLFLCLSRGSDLYSQPVANSALHQLLLRGIDLSGRQEYTEAKKVFDQCIQLAPAHPAGYLNKAILLEAMSLDFETPVPPEFLSLLEKTKQLSLAMQKENPQSWEALYHLGMMHSYTAYYKFRDGGSWIGGLQHGLKATGYLEECLERNPSAFDAFTGIGTYKYWKSRRMSFLTWTPFVSDEREAGIRMLRDAEQKATYTVSQAANSLVWIFIEEERYAEAEAVARRELKKYPANRLFLWGLASATEKAGKWSAARDAYQAILHSIDREVTEKRYIEIQARSKIAKMSYAMRDFAMAKRESDWVLANSGFDTSGFTGDGAERIARRVREAEEIRDSLK